MTMSEKKRYIEVLWVEDNKSLHEIYPLQAETYGIDMVPFDNWNDAYNALTSDYNRWDAIVLDAKCKVDRNSADNACKFLPTVFESIAELSTKNKRLIPWYILSGGGAEVGPINDLIIDKRKKWDGDWPKSFYSKNTDFVALLYRIKETVEKADSNIIMSSLYPDVFQAIREIGLPKEANDYMMKLLKPIHFNVEDNEAYNSHYEYPRLILEYIYRSMVAHNLLPPEMINNRGKDSVNLSACSKLLGTGAISEKGFNVDYKFKVFSTIIRNTVWNITTITGSYVHTTSEDSDDKETIDTKGHIESVGGSPYLLRKIAYELCDIILWYKDFLRKHPNKEENLKLWTKKK